MEKLQSLLDAIDKSGKPYDIEKIKAAYALASQAHHQDSLSVDHQSYNLNQSID